MKKVAIVGTMWSGKTYELKLQAGNYKQVFIIDKYNSRNTQRDISNLTIPNSKMVTSLDEVPANDSESCLLIDEVHLFEVFGATDELHNLWLNSQIDTYCSGLLLDCYNAYRIFPIWSTVFASSTEIIYKSSRNPCAICGCSNTNRNPISFTRPKRKENLSGSEFLSPSVLNLIETNSGDSRIGDDYENICYKCSQKGG